jgi:hypothetical protein
LEKTFLSEKYRQLVDQGNLSEALDLGQGGGNLLRMDDEGAMNFVARPIASLRLASSRPSGGRNLNLHSRRERPMLAGAHNLPGNWESSRFNLPATLIGALPRIGEFETTIVMHNDVVVQGLSEVSAMQDVGRWGIFTIGTGLGNALFANRK